MRFSPERRTPVVLLIVAGAAAVGCASQAMPPGGPPDLAPPVLVTVSPESGAVLVSPKAVTFRFDEVVSERPRGAPSLDQLVLISPCDWNACASGEAVNAYRLIEMCWNVLKNWPPFGEDILTF